MKTIGDLMKPGAAIEVSIQTIGVLIAEIERLRKIEDAVRSVDGRAWRPKSFDNLMAVIENNPRRENADG